MITTPPLEQKYKAQKQLDEEAGHDIPAYFELSHRIAGDVEAKYGFKFKYGRLPGGELEQVVKQTRSA